MSTTIVSKSPRWIDALSDRLNPLVIKELRQGVRSRVLWSAFALLLFACLIISTSAFLASISGQVRVDGKSYFGAFFGCTCFIYIFVIPSMAYQSLVREQEGETWSLLTMTGLGARRVLKGKVSSSLILAVLYSSVVLPFLFFAYFLNGIELSVLLVSVAGALLLMVFLTFTSVCWATFGQTRFWRGLLRTGLIFGTFTSSLSVITIWFDWVRANTLWDTDSWVRIGVMVWQMVSGAYFFYETAIARMSLDSEDCSSGPRRAICFQTVGTWIMAFLLWKRAGRDPTVVVVVALLLFAYLGFTGIFISTDRYGVPKTMERKKGRGWRLLLPGSVRGFRLSATLIFGTLAGAVAMLSVGPMENKDLEILTCVIAAAGYALAYLSAGIIGGQVIELSGISSQLLTRVVFAVVLMLGTLPPVLFDSLVPIASPWIGVLSPVGGILHFANNDFHGRAPVLLVFISVTALALFAAADALLARREPKEAGLPGAASQSLPAP